MNVHAPPAEAAAGAGRMCPFDYRYPPEVFRRTPDVAAETLYVVGGLYGNLAALDEIERMAESERGPVTIVFNGDFHWFDADLDWFAEIERRVAPYRKLRGNIETEIARPGDIGAGCGCAYPDSVDDGTVTRSNDILAQLRDVAAAVSDSREGMSRLPMHLVADVAGARIGIVHGDAWSLAGWRFAHDALDDPARLASLRALKEQSTIDVFASTHTCMAALRSFDTPSGPLCVINNGAAGMPNFSGTTFGVIIRISARPSAYAPLYGIEHGEIRVDALAVHYDNAAFVKCFLGVWPERSAAHASYFGRIVSGPTHTLAQACLQPDI